MIRALRARFRPESLNRVDDVVLFKPLTQVEIEQVVELMLDDLRRRLTEQRMGLEVSPRALAYIARQGFDPVYGARPLRRFIAHTVETRIGRDLLSGDIPDGAVIRVDLGNGELTVAHNGPAADGSPESRPFG